MSGDELAHVYSTYDANKAEIIRIALENEGIACSIENEGQAGLTGVLAVKLYVPAADAERARAFIQQREQRAADRREQEKDLEDEAEDSA